MKGPCIIDTTLRDGEQAPGVVFNLEEKMAIATLLHRLGVDEVEAGTPAIGHEERESIRAIARAGFSFVTSCWCRAKQADLLQAASLGTQSVNISLPASHIQMTGLGKTPSEILGQISSIVRMALDHFPHVTMGAQDASRADINFLEEFIYHATDAGAQRIRISDTVGIMDPFDTHALFGRLKTTFHSINFEFHGHNDLGHATSNAMAAIRSGAACISATVNGLGERAGNSALEEVLANLHYREGITRFNTKIIQILCEQVARSSGTGIPCNKAITGENAFRHESGIHTAAILKDPRTYQVLDPADFGAAPISFTRGKHSGRSYLRTLTAHQKSNIYVPS